MALFENYDRRIDKITMTVLPKQADGDSSDEQEKDRFRNREKEHIGK